MLGRGGMGVVYKARDVRLGRIVAIKTIAEAQHATPEQLGRFLAEAEVVARLQHSNIIQIHAIGEQEGRPYFSLEYAEGVQPGSRRLAQGPMAAGPAARLLETLALAVHAAHRGGVVHRDLKPSNVLLTTDDIPKVADSWPRQTRERQRGTYSLGRGARYAQLHGPGTGRGALERRGPGRRRLRPGGDPLPRAHGPPTVPGSFRD